MSKHKTIAITSLAFAILMTSCTMQQYTPVQTEEVISAPAKSQSVIYDRSRQWFSEYFVSGESVIDYEDAKAGTIIGNGFAKIGSDPLGIIRYNINYSIRVDTKEGRFKVTAKVIKHSNTDSQRPTYDVPTVSQARQDMADRHMASVIADLRSYVTTGGSSSNW